LHLTRVGCHVARKDQACFRLQTAAPEPRIDLVKIAEHGLVPMAPAHSFRVVETTIADIQAAYRDGSLTARQLVQTYLDRIEAYDRNGPSINSVLSLNPNALDEADRLDAALKSSGLVGPLHGVPVLMKDQADIAGLPTTLGSLLFKDYVPRSDCFVVAKLKKAGVIFLGKVTLGELGGGDTHGSLFGSTRNVYDLARTAGGSSGGSGASVSANFCTVAIGQEGFASIRRPAIWNGVVGMRPTIGLVSRGGVYGGWPTTNGSLGPMARSVTDLAKLLDVMVGYDPEDPVTAHGVGKTPESYSAGLNRDYLRGARLGVLREPIGFHSEPHSEDFAKVGEVFDRAIADLRRAGADPGSESPARRPGAARRGRRRHVRAVLRRRQRAVSDPQGRDGVTAVCQGHEERPSALDQCRYAGAASRLHEGARSVDDQSVEGDGGSSAGCDRPQGGRAQAHLDQGWREPAVCRPEGRAAHQHLSDVRTVDCGAGGLHPGQSAGRDHLPGPALR
jgi:Asp-tRNA(Asn)/Glu-tRNA(Gln) amidotransferase A subunit family amidase